MPTLVDLSNARRRIELPYDGRMLTWDLDKVETAYLVWLDTAPLFSDKPARARLERLREVGHKLRDEHGFANVEKFVYAQAAEIYALTIVAHGLTVTER